MGEVRSSFLILRTAMRLPTAGTIIGPCHSSVVPYTLPLAQRRDRAFDSMQPPVFQIFSFRGRERQRQTVMSTAEIDPGDVIPLPRREDLDTKDQKIFNCFTSGSKGVLRGLHGPAGIWLHEPKLAEVYVPFGNYLRFDASLSERVREVCVLAMAGECNSPFEWAAHEPEAGRAGGGH
jgi:hypothetical protein